MKILLLLLGTFIYAGELEVDGDLKVLGNIELDGILNNNSNIAFYSSGVIDIYILTKTNSLYRLTRSVSDTNWSWEEMTTPPVELDNIELFISNSGKVWDGNETIFILTKEGILYGLGCFEHNCDDTWYLMPDIPFNLYD